MVERHGVDPRVAGDFKARRFGSIRNDGGDLGVARFGPGLFARNAQNRLEIASASGDEDDDLLHGVLSDW